MDLEDEFFLVDCPHCGGTGLDEDSEDGYCNKCDGTGQLVSDGSEDLNVEI